jgi:hypothetical protein
MRAFGSELLVTCRLAKWQDAVAVLVPLLALALSFAPAKSDEVPETATAPAAPHSVVLTTRLGRSGDSSLTGKLRVMGIQVTPRLIAVSTNAVSGQLPVAVRDAASPQRLALKLAESTRSQYWEVASSEGSVTRGQVRYVNAKSGVAIVELEEPLAAWERCEGPASEEVQTAVLRSGLTQGAYEVELRPAPDGRWDVTTPVPRHYESAVSYDEKGRCMGLLVGAASPGAAFLLTPTRLAEVVVGATKSIQEARSEVRWSVGFGLGTAIGPDAQVRTSFVGRGDLLVDRRWGMALETSWQAFNDDSLEETPSYRELRARVHHLVFGGLGTFLFGNPAQSVRAGLAAGAGLDLQLHDERGRTLTVAEGCEPPMECAIDVSTDRQLVVKPRLDVILGADLVGLRPVRKRSVAGVRVGYRAHVIVPLPVSSFHAITVTLQF